MQQSVEINRVLGGRLNDIINRHKKIRTFIVIADRRVVRVFTHTEDNFELVVEIKAEPMGSYKGTPNHSLGRIVSSCSRFVRHRLEPRKAPGEQEAMVFAHRITKWLDESLRNNGFDKLVVIAEPTMLGNLRKTMNKHLKDLVSAEAARDLTKMKNTDLYSEIKKIVQL